MKLDIISYHDLLAPDSHPASIKKLETALLRTGIVGISHVPDYETIARAYINAARAFTALPENIKQQYTPDRDAGATEGYELGAERFKDEEGQWQIDDKKASFYAFVPDDPRNMWPREVDLKTPYLALGELIFKTGKLLLSAIGIDDIIGLNHDLFTGYGRMLHYQKEGTATNTNPNWCGGHFDHSVLTGLIPAYYFQNGQEVDEPKEAGLFIIPTEGHEFEKVNAADKSILLFQVGEFGQLSSNDRIHATKHIVKKATSGIERFTFALFYDPADNAVIKKPSSKLTTDTRYSNNKSADGSISFEKWKEASFERYRAK